MIQLRNLIKCELQVSNKVKQSNGVYINTYQKINEYKVTLNELTDNVSASIYGANINKTYRVSSPYNKLENYLSSKINDTEDNISKYFILIDNKRYKIVSVKFKWIDIELI